MNDIKIIREPIESSFPHDYDPSKEFFRIQWLTREEVEKLFPRQEGEV